MLEALARILAPWQDLYAGSALVSTSVTAVHVTSLLVAGGLAISQDRATLHGAVHQPVHRPVTIGLALLLISGLLLAASDIEVYATSRIYWFKMAMVAALLVNGFFLFRHHNRTTARISMTLWLAVTVAGVALTNA